MLRVFQDKFVHSHGTGNCVAACLGSLLEITLKDMPVFLPNDPTIDFWGAWRRWLRVEHGLRLHFIPKPQGPPETYGLCTVRTQRVYPEGHEKAGEPILHMVVIFNGEIVHDPFPTGSQVEEILYYWSLDPVAQDDDDD